MEIRNGVDIVIPVYNALEELKACVDSILKHTDLKKNRLILVDDRSPDPSVYPYLRSLNDSGIVVLRNEENLGFSGTVNRGFAYSNRDVIALNSDTIVTKHWVEKIATCAYSDASIGMVSPYSNNATLCSIPVFCQDNAIPYGLSIDEYAQIIEDSSLRKYPKISVVHGFCMYIKREVLNQVGMLDAQTFEKGYGEENDFCWRAEQFGYIAVLCDDTYIYHSGTTSFVSTDKIKLMQDHSKILEERYPGQMRYNDEYVRDNVHQYLRDVVDIYARVHDGRKHILYVLHADFRNDSNNNIGGTQFHVKDLMNYFRRDNDVFVLSRMGDFLRLTAYYQDITQTFQFYIGKPEVFTPFHSRSIAKEFGLILERFGIDLVHVHHAMNLSLDVFFETKKRNIPLVATLHDHYFICPTARLLEMNKVDCDGEGADCKTCLHHLAGYAPHIDALEQWRQNCQKALICCDMLFAPSETVRTNFEARYPEIAHQIRVIPHGIDHFEQVVQMQWGTPSPDVVLNVEHALDMNYCIDGYAYVKGLDSRICDVVALIEDVAGTRHQYVLPHRNRLDVANRCGMEYTYSGFDVHIPDNAFESGLLKMQLVFSNGGQKYFSQIIPLKAYVRRKKTKPRIAFLGAICEEKGSKIAKKLILNDRNQFDWYFIGQIGDPDIKKLQQPNVFRIGEYQRENISQILSQNEIDLVCILTICAETFCYTLSEAFDAGIPVLTMELGAQAERVKQSHAGWTVPPQATTNQILEVIRKIFADTTTLESKKAELTRRNWLSIGEMCAQYESIYSTLEVQKAPLSAFNHTYYLNAYISEKQSYINGNGNRELVAQVQNLTAELVAIKSSFSYRLMKQIGPMIPCKGLIKRIMRLTKKGLSKFRKRK